MSELQLKRDLARLAAGDRNAFAPVFRELWPRVHRFCRRYLGNDPDADDAAQWALEKFFAQASDYDASRSVFGWALTFALWECRTLRRQSSRRKAETLEPDVGSSSASPEQEVEREQLRMALNAAIEQLSEIDRETLGRILMEEGFEDLEKDSRFRKRKQRAISRLKETWRRLYGT